MRLSIRRVIRSVVDFAAFAVGATAAVAQLAGFSSGVGRLLLTVVGIVSLLYLVVRSTLLYYIAIERRLERQLTDVAQQLATVQVGHQRYVEAIERIIDQEGPIYTETLTLTVTIGCGDEEDTIVERRCTRPRPRVTHRAIRPIVPTDNGKLLSMDEIGFEARLLEVTGKITALPLTGNHRPRAWLVFDPGLTEPFEWTIKYRPHGLWAPLRKEGFDRLAWTDRLPASNGGNSLLTDLVVRFVFPAGGRPPSVEERHGFGASTPPQRRGSDGWLVEWRDPQPAGRRYEWDLAQQADRTAS